MRSLVITITLALLALAITVIPVTSRTCNTICNSNGTSCSTYCY